MEIEIRGHSGCHIEIVNGGERLFINKSTYDRNYIPRLYKQAVKQREAAKNIHQHIRIPEIFGIERTEDYLKVKMEYIYSKNYVEYFEDAGFDQVDYFIHALMIFIDFEIASSKMVSISRGVLLDKLEDICDKVAHNNCINCDEEILEILKQSAYIFESLEENLIIPIGQCHGDLTFSNILFNGNNYFLIDFLDSFIESPLIDLVKIRQDSQYGWSQLMYEHKLDAIRMKIISDKIDHDIDACYSKYTWYEKYYKVFQLMNFLRVIQYAKEEKVIIYLKTVLSSML